MRLAGERRQRLRAFGKIARLVQDLAFERERLIGADAIGVRTLGADRKRLGLRQFESHTFERAPARQISIFDRALVDLGRDDLSVQTRRQEEGPAARAPRAQNQRSSAAPQRRRMCPASAPRQSAFGDELETVGAKEIEHRRRRLFNRASRHVDRRASPARRTGGARRRFPRRPQCGRHSRFENRR